MLSVLLLLWWSSAVMAAASVLGMGVLIAARLRHRKRETLREAERKVVRALLLRIADGDGAAARALAAHATQTLLLAETAQEFAALVRGGDARRIQQALRDVGLDRRLREVLRRGSPDARASAAESLALFPGRSAADALIGASGDRSPAVRLAALRALIALGEAPPLSALLAALREADVDHSLLLTELLAALGPEHAPAMREALADAARPLQVRMALAAALGAAGDYGALPGLSQAAGSSEPLLRAAAVRAMGALAHPVSEPLIRLAIADAAWEVRAEAVEAVGRARLSSLGPALQRRLKDEVWYVRFKASQALAALGDPGLARLEAASRSKNPLVRRSASMALQERRAA
jgi:HEAT repeat protein